MGNVHGHLIPRPNARSDGDGRMEGGLARMYTKIDKLRGNGKKALLINTGDTVQGSAEALYTKGQAVVDVINLFKIDVFAPGNWEFVYGTERFRELFTGVNGAAPLAPWNTIAANVYYDGVANPAYAALHGQSVVAEIPDHHQKWCEGRPPRLYHRSRPVSGWYGCDKRLSLFKVRTGQRGYRRQ